MDYQPFVIISYLRSGTHLLRTALESHPKIVCQSEVFNSDNPRLPYSLDTSTQQVLDQWVYRDIATTVRHVGFVLQAYHPHALKAFPGIRPNPKWADIWDILVANKNLKVIHLRRDNLLRRHLSHQRARASGQWHNWDAQQLEHISLLEQPPKQHINQYQAPTQPLTLDAESMVTDFKEVQYWHDWAEQQFKQHDCIHIQYEELQHDFVTHSHRILEFLGAKPVPLHSGVRKLENRRLSDSIANYSELKQSFTGSRWQVFFEG